MLVDSYDYIVIGAGSAGLQLVLSLLKDEELRQKRILILDKDPKNKNDKTWCFWEDQVGDYDQILYKSWSKGNFQSRKHSVDLEMGSYVYKMLKSIDFYNHAREVIGKNSNVSWLFEEALEIDSLGTVRTDQSEYRAEYIFDSRIPEEFNADKKSIKLLQHFLGWVIKFEEDTFDPDNFTMMDFRENKEDATSFTYILPFDKRTALVEFTLFSAELLVKDEYEKYLRNYIDKLVSGKNYSIIDAEQGVIPMTSFPFHSFQQGNIVKIGTAGGWVKPSSGYSFKISQKFIKRVISNIKSGINPSHKITQGRHRFYDSIFLGILNEENEKGEALFETMYSKLPGHLIFSFLDEETSLKEDIRIMSIYANYSFTKTFIKQLFN